MSQNVSLRLDGYFDRNFGDDYMFKLVAHYLPDVDFLVNVQEREIPALAGAGNVHFVSGEHRQVPSVTVIGSGFMISDWRMLKNEVSLLLRGMGPGDYCIGCNIEPFQSPFRAFVVGKKLDQYRLITCRDRKSEAWLRKHCKKPNIHYAPDILFSLPDEWLPQKKADGLLGIAVLHRPGDQEDAPYYRTMAEMADLWIEQTGKEVLFMAFDSGSEDDTFTCRAIKKMMSRPEKAHIVAYQNGTEILEAVSRCEKMICARFHSVVLALRMGIPFYPLPYREKMRNMLKDIGYPYSGSDLERIDKTDLCAFLTQQQKPHELPQEIFECAKQHMRLLRAAIEREEKK